MLERVAFLGLMNDFYVLNQLSLCLSKEKVAKRKDTSQGRLLSRGLNVARNSCRSCPLNSRHAHYAGEAVILDGLKIFQRMTFSRAR
ncbi:MAG: hypothetical protein II902_02425 [Selenomonadaceae bacterium]|nr:hypothetical protein [Selenomonadaceae bacterium]